MISPAHSSLAAALTEQRDALLTFCDALSDTERTSPRTPECWSIQDFVGHLSFWEQQTLNHIRDTFKQGRPTPLPPDSLDDDLNRRAADHRRAWTWHRVRAEFQNTRTALIERINALSETDLQFYVPSPWVNDTRIISLSSLIQEDVLEHAALHFDEMQLWHRLIQTEPLPPSPHGRGGLSTDADVSGQSAGCAEHTGEGSL